MKKIICLTAVVLMVVSVAFAAGKMKIAAKDLPALKGTWTGILSFGIFEAGTTSPVTLEILNDAVPVKAKLTVENVPDQIGKLYGVMSGKNVFENDGGVITSQGTLMWTAPDGNVFELTKGEKKLDLWYFFKGLKGEASLKKK
jgi:hypothetical protein